MPDDAPTPSRDLLTAARPLLPHLIYAAAAAWVAAYVLTGRFPAPAMPTPPQPNTGVVRVVVDTPPKTDMSTCPAITMPAPGDAGPRDSAGAYPDYRDDPDLGHQRDPAPSHGSSRDMPSDADPAPIHDPR